MSLFRKPKDEKINQTQPQQKARRVAKTTEGTWVEIDIITGIIQNTATKETYTLRESPRNYQRAPGPLPKFYWWGFMGNTGGGAGPSEYRLALTEAGQCRQWKYKLVELDPKRWPTVDDFKNDLSVEELKAMYEGHPLVVVLEQDEPPANHKRKRTLLSSIMRKNIG